MNWFSVLALCVSANAPSDIDCESVRNIYKHKMAEINLSPTDIDAITRTAYAEAANQGVLGLSGVIFTILNRKISGHFSSSIEVIVNSTNQFEPVTKAGGWQNLPESTAIQLTRVNTILDLARSGYMKDPTNGALYFQNASVVSERVKSGEVSANLVHFGDSPISATIDDHTFYSLMCQLPKTVEKPQLNNSVLHQLDPSTSGKVKQLRGGSRDKEQPK